MTLKKVIENALDYVLEQEPGFERERIRRQLAAAYDSIADNAYVSQHDVGTKLDAVMPSRSLRPSPVITDFKIGDEALDGISDGARVDLLHDNGDVYK